jgi:hypothetical protein
MRRPLPAPTRVVVAAAIAVACLASLSFVACGDLKSAGEVADASNADGSSGSSGQSGLDSGIVAPALDAGVDAADGAAGLRGPGPHGSLPSGYCCNSDNECRYRRCVDTTDAGGTGKTCLDECYTQAFCTRPDLTFTCEQPTPSARGLCKPPPGFTCIPAQEFVRGSLPAGACCNAGSPAVNDGTAASACEGNQCAATGSGPLICTHRCSVQGECPGGFVCNLFGTSKACVRQTSSYTCQ